MIKKIVLITVFVLFAGVLLAGGIYRTNAKSANEVRLSENPEHGDEIAHEGEQSGERQGQGLGNDGVGQGRNQQLKEENGTAGEGQGEGQGNQGQGQGRDQQAEGENAQGQGQGNQGQGQGRNQQAESENAQGQGNQGQGQGRSQQAEGEDAQGQGQGYQGGQGNQPTEGETTQGQGQGRNQQAEGEMYVEHESLLVEGTVIQAPASGVDMIVQTADGQEVLIGTGPGYLDEMGFVIVAGDAVQVTGYFENDEFKAETITVGDNSIAMRDEFGRPMWSGAARGGRGGGNQGQGQGNNEADS